MAEDFEICGYTVQIHGDTGPTGEAASQIHGPGEARILRCDMYAHIGRHHSTGIHEFWRSRDDMGKTKAGLFIVRDFQTGIRQEMEATECPS